MRLIYIAGPYRADTPWQVERNIQAAKERALGLAVSTGGAVGFICPHANSGMMDGEMSDEYWLAMGLEQLRRCDAVLLVGAWRASEGTKAEIEEARRLGFPVYESLRGALKAEAPDIHGEMVALAEETLADAAQERFG